MERASLILVAIVFLLANPHAAATPGQNAPRLATAADYRKEGLRHYDLGFFEKAARPSKKQSA